MELNYNHYYGLCQMKKKGLGIPPNEVRPDDAVYE